MTLRTAAPEREEASASLIELEPIAAADQLVELEAPLAIELDDHRHVDRRAGRAHLGAQDLLAVGGEPAGDCALQRIAGRKRAVLIWTFGSLITNG